MKLTRLAQIRKVKYWISGFHINLNEKQKHFNVSLLFLSRHRSEHWIQFDGQKRSANLFNKSKSQKQNFKA